MKTDKTDKNGSRLYKVSPWIVLIYPVFAIVFGIIVGLILKYHYHINLKP